MISKIDNSGQAFYGVAAKHDALPRPHVIQDVLGFVRARAKCVSTPLKATTFPQKVSFSARTSPEMCEKRNRVSESVFAECPYELWRVLSRNSSWIFRDFRFPGMLMLTKSRTSLAERFDEFNFKNVGAFARAGDRTFALLTL